MRVGFLSLALIVVVFASAHGGLASATRIASAQQPRNQTQSQEGLPPDKKKALAGYGPEDVFGQSSERENNNNRTGGRQRRPLPTPAPPSSPPPRSPATSAPAPAPTSSAAPIQPSEETPSPTIAAASLDSGVQQPSLSQGASVNIISGWKAPLGLIALALIVLSALIVTLTKLVEKIRESSSG